MATDYDPRIVELYDVENPDGPDHAYYRALAAEHEAKNILDLGCGTGILTVTFAGRGSTVTGVDPSAAMLDYATGRPGAEDVTWIHGTASALAANTYDLIVMTGNVAQHIPDPLWQHTLTVLRAAAQPGAVLAFESRNPARRAWEDWAQEAPETSDTKFGTLTQWCEVEEVQPNLVRLDSFSRMESTGEIIHEETNLSFRSAVTISKQLEAAGFMVTAVRGDWQKNAFSGEQSLMVFEAQAV